MKKKILILVLVLIIATSCLTGCNTVARNFGGTISVELPKGQKLINVTWKENSLWYLTKPMSNTDIAETYKFSQDSNFGIVEGLVIIQEIK